jgi:hypothetical protein
MHGIGHLQDVNGKAATPPRVASGRGVYAEIGAEEKKINGAFN